MKKIWIIGLLGIGMCSSCQESYQEKFIRIAQAENAACPRRLNETIVMDSTRYDAQRNVVHYYYTTFKTIEKFKQMPVVDCDILFIDESSMVNNDDILAVLNKAVYKAIIIVGDISQIESIKYGNWFNLCKRYYSNKIVFELSETHRTTEEELLNLWSAVRNNDKKAITIMSNQEYSEELSDNVFIRNDEEEIVLCLNYDGMYGINNINKIMQNTNPNP